MDKFEIKSLIHLIYKWTPDCDKNCKKCGWGVRWSRIKRYVCPIDLAQNMIYMKEKDPTAWNELRG